MRHVNFNPSLVLGFLVVRQATTFATSNFTLDGCFFPKPYAIIARQVTASFGRPKE